MDKAEGEIPVDDQPEPPTPAETAAPAIPGIRAGGEVSDEPTPEPVDATIQEDPRLADITETVEPHGANFLLIFTRGSSSHTIEFTSEPSDATRAEYRKQAEDAFDFMDAQLTTELQDRRRPK